MSVTSKYGRLTRNGLCDVAFDAPVMRQPAKWVFEYDPDQHWPEVRFIDPPDPKPKGWPEWMDRVGVDEIGEIWIPARLLSDQESWTAMVNSEPMILDDIGSPYIRAGWCLNQIQDPARRASVEQVRENILKRVRAVSDRENARQQDRETA